MDEYVVTVVQETGFITLRFSKMSYALEFAQSCLECGDEGTEVKMMQKQEG